MLEKRRSCLFCLANPPNKSSLAPTYQTIMPHPHQFYEQLTHNIERVIMGKGESIELLIVALLSDGHVLIEDVPGTGKTMLARALAISLGLDFKRVQCTPDLLPSDITGISVYNQKTGVFEFKPGPIFTHILLVDEINRATPRTQAALLEAMAENQVTVDGQTYPLNEPFLVIATQNPIEYEGTFPLPEAQLDRFLMKIQLGYLEPQIEKELLHRLDRGHPIDALTPLAQQDALTSLKDKTAEVHIDDSLQEYIIALVQATRHHPDLALGVSPRGSIGLYQSSKALAVLRDRDFVIPDDIKYLAPSILAHRCLVQPISALRGINGQSVIAEILAQTPLPLESPDNRP